MFKFFSHVLVGICFASLVANTFGGDIGDKRSRRSKTQIRVSAVAVGPSTDIVEAAKLRTIQSVAVQQVIGKFKYRLLSLEFVDNGTISATNYRAVIYDYTNDRTFVANGDLAGKQPVTVSEEAFSPLPSVEEFEAAVKSVKADARFASAMNSRTIRAFQPMPPTTILDGTIDRLINVGLDGGGGATAVEIVSVSMKDGHVFRYDNAAPPFARAVQDACGVLASGQQPTPRGLAGQAQLTVTTQGPNPVTLWDMLITRPSASSGTNASGIELQNVKYKGKLVFKRAHVPILDIKYDNDVCGPFRDWEFNEDMFQASPSGAIDIAPGIRVLAPGQIATTELDTGDDFGVFQGVAIYVQDNGFGPEVVLVTEMQAGWYRYIMEWRFATDGTIRPRFGFGATSNSCVCITHTHHAYWRFDFDIVNSNNKVFMTERGRKFMAPITTETTMNKSLQTRKALVIQNATGDEAYELIPNATDGVVDAFGAHDLWVLRFKSPTGDPVTSEYDDGRTCCGGPNEGINIDSWVNGESLDGQDVVVWYGAHFVHSDGSGFADGDRFAPNILAGDHVVGPDLRPIRW